jgi:hypothetical protein
MHGLSHGTMRLTMVRKIVFSGAIAENGRVLIILRHFGADGAITNASHRAAAVNHFR